MQHDDVTHDELRGRFESSKESGVGFADDTCGWDAKIAELAALHPMEYDRRRKAEAKALDCQLSTLDREVENRRKGGELLQGREIAVPEVELWPDPVDGDDLLCAVADTIAEYVVLPEHVDTVVALWIAHCHAFSAFSHTPRLNVTSPEKRCGKTLLLDVIGTLVPRPLSTENMTTAVFFRAAAQFQPTFLADEYDSYFRNNEDLRGALNAGHKRGGQVLRVEGDSREIRAFPVFSPVAFGGIRELPDTLQDRSIIVRLKRAVRSEIVARKRFDSRKTDDERALRSQLARWVKDNFSRLEHADPDMGSLFNRQADNWRPLYAIADAAGGDWPGAVRRAVEMLTAADDEQSIGIMLLEDVQVIFLNRAKRNLPYAGNIKSADLAAELHQIEGRPWAEWGRQNKPISPNQIARLLKAFRVIPGTIRQGESTGKGYRLEQLEDAFSRYLADGSVTSTQVSNQGGFGDFQSVTAKNGVTDEKSRKHAPHLGCDDVTDRIGGDREESEYPPDLTPEEIEEDRRERAAVRAEASSSQD